ncbi:MAG: AAA family ATPase [Caldisericia bacterium]|nr:AAA family ATPase [Caldisericia bacterium]
MNQLYCIAGMCGAGKSVVSDFFIRHGFEYLRFGQITMDELKKRNLPINEENERLIREELRATYGMGAFALLNIEKIELLLKNNNVVADGLYSFAEYKILKEKMGRLCKVIAVYASPTLRYARLAERKLDPSDTAGRNRPLSPEESKSRDYREIEKSDKGGPIAMADYTIINTRDLPYLYSQLEEILHE